MKLLLILSSIVGFASATSSILLAKTIHHDAQSRCSTGQEVAHGFKDDPVTYCYEVTNTGTTALTGVRVIDRDMRFSSNVDGTLSPGDSVFVGPFSSKIGSTLSTNAQVRANDPSGARIRDNDTAGTMLFDPMPTDVYCAPDSHMNMLQKFGVKKTSP